MTSYASHLNGRRRHGSIYLVVLGFSMLAAVLAIGSVLASRVQLRAASTASDMAQARIIAQSAVELSKYYMLSDPTWRTDQPSGLWTLPATSINGGTFSISVTDPIDGDLTNRPHDPITMTATAYYGNARQILTTTLAASPTPMPVLQYAISTSVPYTLSGTTRLILGTGTIATAKFSSDPGTTVEGNVNCTANKITGTVYGTIGSGTTPPAMPAASIAESYAKLGTLITLTSNTIANTVLGPGCNPWGTPNAEGVYVIRPNADITIRNTRIYGTLVVVNTGHKVILDTAVLLQKYRSDYPVLIINGDCTMQFTSFGNSLSESALATNFNPTGVPYNGITDSDTSDTYPSEIDGLVHITGAVNITQPCIIRGALICSSTATAPTITAPVMQVVYDPTLYTSPPQYYTTQVYMVPQTGTWLPVVN